MSASVYTPEERTARALERIADTLDDYMEMTIATATTAQRSALGKNYEFSSPEQRMISDLLDVVVEIGRRRAAGAR